MIQLQNIIKNFASQELFRELNFQINAGNRVGMVGRNGSGKSTLFKMILGEETPDSGEIILPKNYRIGALRQHLEFSEKTLKEEAALALSGEMRYETYRVEKILFGLGFSAEDLTKDPLSFSGGFQIRINLAKLLVTEPNMLLLDEPTNYLDIVSLRWLKNFLRSFAGEVILITHDRDFMDGVCTHTMGIVRKRMEMVQGGTQKFYEQLALNDELYIKRKQTQERKVKELEEFIAKNKTRASTAALAQSKVKQLEKMEILEDLTKESRLSFSFNFKETPSKIMLEVERLSFGYTPENLLFKDITFSLKRGETLGIIGKNGKGKSTLLNLLARELTPLSGTISSHPSIAFGHFGQTNIARLHKDATVTEEIQGANLKLSTQDIRSICGAMMFSGERADKKVSLLSGGEKSRVMLGQIIAREVNVLFLDEPTNHLDMESIEALSEAIERFEGGAIIVTHSEELLRSVCDRLIVFSHDKAEYFDGGYDLFLEKIGWEEEGELPSSNAIAKEKTQAKSNTKENKKLRAELVRERNAKAAPFKKEVERLEALIIESEEELGAKHEALIAASNAGESAKLMELSKVVAALETAVEKHFEAFEVAQTQLDAINAEYEGKIEELE